MKRFEYDLFADYFQFYLQDEAASRDEIPSWAPDAVDRMLEVTPGVVVVGTVRNMNVPVVVEVHDSPPLDDLGGWDQVNECSLDVPSGRIVVAGCTDYFPDAARIDVAPGCYRARVYYAKLADISADQLTGHDNYRVVLWKDTPCPVTVLKKRATPEPGS